VSRIPLVAYDVLRQADPAWRVEPATAQAVPAQPYTHIVEDEPGNPGVIVRALVVDAHVRPLGEFEDGQEVFIEGEPEELLFIDEPEAGRLWWRATVIER
jgi:hypothetical protein